MTKKTLKGKVVPIHLRHSVNQSYRYSDGKFEIWLVGCPSCTGGGGGRQAGSGGGGSDGDSPSLPPPSPGGGGITDSSPGDVTGQPGPAVLVTERADLGWRDTAAGRPASRPTPVNMDGRVMERAAPLLLLLLLLASVATAAGTTRKGNTRTAGPQPRGYRLQTTASLRQPSPWFSDSFNLR